MNCKQGDFSLGVTVGVAVVVLGLCLVLFLGA